MRLCFTFQASVVPTCLLLDAQGAIFLCATCVFSVVSGESGPLRGFLRGLLTSRQHNPSLVRWTRWGWEFVITDLEGVAEQWARARHVTRAHMIKPEARERDLMDAIE